MSMPMPAAAIQSLSSTQLSCLSLSTAPFSRYSSLSSLRFTQQLRRQVRIGYRNSALTSSCPRSLPLIEAKKQTFSSFDDLLAKSDKPVLVDFYATWCGPCQFMVPILSEVSVTLNDKIQVVKIDTEKYPSIADKYKIQALPTFILFKDGELFDRFEGALTADQLIQRIEASLQVKE